MQDNKIVHLLTGYTANCKQYGVYTYTTECQDKGGKIHTTIEFIIDRFRRDMILSHWLVKENETRALSYPYKEWAVIVAPVNAVGNIVDKLTKKWFNVKKVFLMKTKEDIKDCPNSFSPKINNLC